MSKEIKTKYGERQGVSYCGGLHPRDRKRINKMWKRMERLGIDPLTTQRLGPECLLESEEFGSSYQNLHTEGEFKK